MKEQCRTCGEWFEESEMFETDYHAFGPDTEFVCEGCYDECYAKCKVCGEIRENGHLDDHGVCDANEGFECKEADHA